MFIDNCSTIITIKYSCIESSTNPKSDSEQDIEWLICRNIRRKMQKAVNNEGGRSWEGKDINRVETTR